MRRSLSRKAKGSTSFDPLPIEIIVHLLSFVGADELLKCRLVCSQWRKLIDNEVFREKASRENKIANNGKGFHSFSEVLPSLVGSLNLPWYVFHAVVKFDPFNRNLVRNSCGQDGLDHWKSRLGEWTVLQEPSLNGIPDFDGYPSCFSATSDCGSFIKNQKIIFKNYGLSDIVMRSLQPSIMLSEWCYNCSCDKNNCWPKFIVLEFNSDDCMHSYHYCSYDTVFKDSGFGWKKLSRLIKFKKSTTLLAFVNSFDNINHTCGLKVTGSTVKVLLPIKFKCA